jgi:hypothetical protein
MKLDEGDYLAHYGILRRSGRYPWGSGKDPHQRSKTFLAIIKEYEDQGMSHAEIAKLFNVDDEDGKPTFTSRHIRALKSRAIHIQKEAQVRQVQELREKGVGWSEIGRKLGVNESTARSLGEPGRLDRLNVLQQTSNMLKRQVDEKTFVDVGAHVQLDLPLDHDRPPVSISKDKFETSLIMLKEEGYAVATFGAPQMGTGEKTTYKVLLKPPKPNMSQKEINKHAFVNRDKIGLIAEKTDDGGRTWHQDRLEPPLNIDSKRVGIRYKEHGGTDADGVIYVRPGVPDVSLGKSHYAQVRIAVDGTHYLKGMAIYKDDLPKGVDLLFNTNKSDTGNKLDALKEMKRDKDGNIDPVNPFGAAIKQGGQIKDEHGNVTSAMNLIHEEGDWSKWSRNLSRQVLSKQSPELAESQLAVTYDRQRQEFDRIAGLTNPLIKRKLLETFSDETDSKSVYLKAANLPNQATKVILPVPGLKPDEIFSPNYNNGERVALVRFPHAGRFEIPVLTVNNRNREAQDLFTQGQSKEIRAPDAVGIHPKVAEHLSGADFDGDHVVVIPNNRGTIQADPALEGLKNFDPQKYKVPTEKEDPVNGRTIIPDDSTGDRIRGDQMGRVTNLISDMTIRGANSDELARAVRHSMVVIDAQKHNLDYKASEQDNGILDLKRRYQGVTPGGQLRGASTLITRATARDDVNTRRPARVGEGGPINPQTGEKNWVDKEELNSAGKPKKFQSKKLAETKDAYTLIDPPGTKIERIYADHSNRLKALANEARKEMVATKPTKRSASAAKIYAAEVESLNSKLNQARKNAPFERKAQRLAETIAAQRRRANPELDASEKRKIKSQALDEARFRTGAHKDRIDITDREWEAIQHGAISIQKLEDILRNTDVDKLRERATPPKQIGMSANVLSRAKQMKRSGFTDAEIADALDVSASAIQRNLADEGVK